MIIINGIDHGDGLYVDCYDNMYVADSFSPSKVYLCGKK